MKTKNNINLFKEGFNRLLKLIQDGNQSSINNIDVKKRIFKSSIIIKK